MAVASVAARATGNPGVNNTAWLFFVLAMAFLFFITVRGDLPKWLGLLGLGKATSAAPSTVSGGTPPVAGGLPALPPLPAVPGGSMPLGTTSTQGA